MNRFRLSIAVAVLTLFVSLPSALAAGSSDCPLPPPAIGSCPSNYPHYYMDSGEMACNLPITCGGGQNFDCFGGSKCYTSSVNTAVCSGTYNYGTQASPDCAENLNLIRDPTPSTNTLYQVTNRANTSILGRAVYVPDTPCATGNIPVWNDTTKVWTCGSGGFWLAGTGANINDIYNSNTGNVGIGTSAPNAIDKFSVYQSGAVTSYKSSAYFENTATNSTTDGINKFGIGVRTTGTFVGGSGSPTKNYAIFADNFSGGGDENYGLFTSVMAGSGTLNYGAKIVTSAGAAQTAYGLHVDVGAGTGTEYAAAFLNGNVGIGTATPGSKLHITTNGAELFGSALVLDQNAVGNSDGPKIGFYKLLTTAPTAKAWSAGILNGVGVDTFAISENGGISGFGIPRLAIVAGGNVGIGKIPSSYYKLDVQGDGNFNGTLSINSSDVSQYFINSPGTSGQVWKSDGMGSGVWGTDDTGASGPWLQTSNEIYLPAYAPGYFVGIGTTNPGSFSAHFGIESGTNPSNYLGIRLQSNDYGYGNGINFANYTPTTGRNYTIYSGSDGKFHFKDGVTNTDRILIDKDGNVGWGTAGSGLNVDQGGSIELRGTSGTQYIDFSNDSASDNDARIVLSSNDLLSISGATLTVGATNYPSDQRYKKNIQPLSNALENLLKLRGVHYEWSNDEIAERMGTHGVQIGFIAQEVEPVIPEVVLTMPDGYKAIDYAKITPLLAEAIKEQQTTIEKQGKMIEDLQYELEALKAQR